MTIFRLPHRTLPTFLALCFALVALGLSADSKTPQTDTKVYYFEGKKRVHVKGCKRLATTEGTITMTLAAIPGREAIS